MVRLTIFFLEVFIVNAAFRLDVQKYERNICMSHKIPSGITPVYVQAFTDCALACNLDINCSGIYYSEINKICILTLGTAYTIFDDSMDAMFYTKINSNLQTPLTTVTESNCPSTFVQDVSLIGRSGSQYTLRIYQQLKSVDDAELWCARHGMHLFKVTSVVKVDDVSRFLERCHAYNGYDYWTDAKRHVTESGTGQWKNCDGDVIPNGTWCHQQPGHDVNEDCARLQSSCAFNLADFHCNQDYRFICE